MPEFIGNVAGDHLDKTGDGIGGAFDGSQDGGGNPQDSEKTRQHSNDSVHSYYMVAAFGYSRNCADQIKQQLPAGFGLWRILKPQIVRC
jgi:hypothetical protein